VVPPFTEDAWSMSGADAGRGFQQVQIRPHRFMALLAAMSSGSQPGEIGGA
jgi:hypothetical protein